MSKQFKMCLATFDLIFLIKFNEPFHSLNLSLVYLHIKMLLASCFIFTFCSKHLFFPLYRLASLHRTLYHTGGQYTTGSHILQLKHK